VDPTAADPLSQDGIGNIELDDRVHALTGRSQHLIQGLGLRDGAREPIQDEALGAIARLNAVLDDAHDDVVTHQPS